MVGLGCFSEMYIKFQFWGSGALYLRFEGTNLYNLYKLARKVQFGILVPIKGINKKY